MGVVVQRVVKAGRRSYGQGCAVARALDVVGERWTLLLVRELMFGPRRFGELLEALAGIGPNLLSARLKALTDEGVVRRIALRSGRGSRSARAEAPGPQEGAARGGGGGAAGNGIGYELTESGRALQTVVLDLARWELSRPRRAASSPSDAVLPEWGILALQARLDATTSSGISEVYRLDCEGRPFRVRVESGAVDIRVGADPAAAVVLELDSATLARLALGELSLESAAVAGQVQVRGSPFAVARFARAFRLEQGEAA